MVADLEREALARADADVVLMAAAVSDFRPVAGAEAKRPRADGRWVVELEPTPDVLREVASRRVNGGVVVAFAADLGDDGLARAREKLHAKGANLLVFNDVSRSDIGFDASDNEVVLVTDRGERHVGKAAKESIAATVLDEVERILESNGDR
jgi:phosphopantothenoylcysteine synthetase/decarboxylase